MKTCELTGPALDWAVAKCEQYPMGIWYDEDGMPMIRDDEVPEWQPSTDWSQGGPIIGRERISVGTNDDDWCADITAGETGFVRGFGPTPLIAAMRCYVASKLGGEVDVPEELR